jgi:hypothetical protein
MTFSLYAATIPSYLQIIGAVDALVDKAVAWCAETGASENDLIMARLVDDMLPFGYQVKSVAEHSIGAIEGVRAGVYSPDTGPFPMDFAGLKAKLAAAAAALKAIDPAEVDSFIGRDMRFEFGPAKMDFTAENFLLSFAQPNFYFHAATAYDILRSKGVKIGKRDFMGRPRLKM